MEPGERLTQKEIGEDRSDYRRQVMIGTRHTRANLLNAVVEEHDRNQRRKERNLEDTKGGFYREGHRCSKPKFIKNEGQVV